jgi:hypothetical protein
MGDAPPTKRARKATPKGAEYSAELERKKTEALARIEAKKRAAKTQVEMDELAELFKGVTTSTDVDDLASMMSRLGGRRRKTRKVKKQGRRRTYKR